MNPADSEPPALPVRRLRRFQLAGWLIVPCVIFCVLFPKGGMVMEGVPVTWGYLLLGVGAGLTFVFHIINRTFRLPRKYLISWLLTLPFAVVVIGALFLNRWEQFGYVVAMLTNVCVLPFLFLILLSYYFNRSATIPFLIKTMYYCVLAASVYGIVLFTYKQSTGQFFEIPFITTNGQQDIDLGERHNARGQIFKLISTYNNGNIYGVCTLMLLPLCAVVAPSLRGQIFPYIAVFLTLSRTAWVGLFTTVLFRLGRFDRKLLRRIILAVLYVGIVIGGISAYLYFAGRDWAWIFDSNLGGRADQVANATDLSQITFFPDQKFGVIREMVYFSMLDSFGILGLATYILAMAGPLIVAFAGVRRKARGAIFQEAAIKGGVIYLIVSFIDGAYILIPVMAFYWFVVALALRSERDHSEPDGEN